MIIGRSNWCRKKAKNIENELVNTEKECETEVNIDEHKKIKLENIEYANELKIQIENENKDADDKENTV